MKLPETVQVGHFEYEIVETPHTTDYGNTDVLNQLILVKPGQGPDCQRDTVLHEIIHAVCENVGLVYEFKDDDLEEKVIRRLAPALLDVLRRNPKLVRFLVAP